MVMYESQALLEQFMFPLLLSEVLNALVQLFLMLNIRKTAKIAEQLSDLTKPSSAVAVIVCPSLAVMLLHCLTFV